MRNPIFEDATPLKTFLIAWYLPTDEYVSHFISMVRKRLRNIIMRVMLILDNLKKKL